MRGLRAGAWPVAAALCLSLSGCEPVRNATRDAVERIDAARPVSAKVRDRAGHLEQVLSEDAAAREAFLAELDARYRVRALDCARGYSPSAFDSDADVRAKLTDLDCFEKHDDEIFEWLGYRRLAGLVAAEPLVESGDDVRDVVATSAPPELVAYAQGAAVAVVASGTSVEVLDLASGETLFKDPRLGSRARGVAISPNGRLFAVAVDAGLVLRAAADGEALVELPGYQHLTWLDAATAVLVKQSSAGAELWDLRSEQKTALKGLTAYVTRVVPVGNENRFVVATHGALLAYEWRRRDGGLQATLVDQRVAEGAGWNESMGTRTSDGLRFVVAGRGLTVTDLRTLETTQVDLSPVTVGGPSALPAGEEVLLQATIPSIGTTRSFVYSIVDNSFAHVADDEVVRSGARLSTRPTYVPSVERLALVTGTTIRLVSDVDRGPRYGPDALVQAIEEERRAEQEERAAQLAQRLGYRSEVSVGGVPVIAGPIATAAGDAAIEAVGVYQSSSYDSRRPGMRATAPGPVNVLVKRAEKPIVLVLSSHEPVHWRVSLSSGAELRAVLLSGYHDSTVSGIGDVRVVNLGRMYAHEQGSGSFSQLQTEVMRWTGKPIESFQGRYSGNSFTVGGR